MDRSSPSAPSPRQSLDSAALARVAAFLRDGVSAAVQAADLPILPGYRLEQRLGAGGQSEVFLGWRDGSDRPVAVKLLNRRLGDGIDTKLALRQVDLSMHHIDCLPRVIDHGVHQGRLFIATEYIDGLHADEHCTTRSLDRRARVVLLVSIAKAVHSLHVHGIIHRDLKPSNILVTASGEVMLIDLGIAKELSHDATETLSGHGHPIGTLGYMPPEQARGELPTTCGDVYSLGAIAYKLLTGHTPHDIDTTFPEAVRRIGQEPSRAPRDLDRSIPPSLAAVLSKATAVKVENRYASAAEFAVDLERWLEGRTVTATPPTAWRKATEWAGRHPVIVTAGASVAMACAIFAVTTLLVWRNNQIPAAVRSAVEGGDVQLVSRSGNILYEWKRASVRQLLDRPKEFGGGKIVLIGHLRRDQPQLCAYDANHPEKLLWSSGYGPEDFRIPPLEGFTAPALFAIASVEIAEVFPESPGQEIIAVHQHRPWGVTTIRIYDLNGKILYEAWHNGHIKNTYWLSKEGMLVFAGVNSEVYWKCRGHPEAEASWPMVIFAIKPIFGQESNWIATANEKGPMPTGTVQPEWYKCVLPASVADDGGWLPSVSTPGTVGLADTDKILVTLAEGFYMLLDSKGNFERHHVMATRYQESEASSESERTRALEKAYLGELPKILPGSGPECRPKNDK